MNTTELEQEIECLLNAELNCYERAFWAWTEQEKEKFRRQAEWNRNQADVRLKILASVVK